MPKRNLLNRACILVALVVAHAAAAAQPNIIFVLCDDLGWGDLGCFHQNGIAGTKKHATPQLDTFAAEGVQMRQHYCGAPVCAPSRASLLLGVHQGHANVRDNQFDKALEDNHSLGTVLREAGYATALIGKYGLQGSGETPAAWPAYPTRRGFDFFFGYVRHGDGHTHYPDHVTASRGVKEVYEQDQMIRDELDKCYTTDLFTARAKKWIVDHRTASPGQPFFLMLTYDTPHAALQVPTQAYPAGGGTSGGIQWTGTPGAMINTASGTIDTFRHPDYTGHGWSDGAERFASMVRRIDDCMGDLITTLDDLGIDDSTLVVFSSDNGPHSESYIGGVSYAPSQFDSFGPFDGIKRDTWEGGIRVPTLVRWPGTVTAGAVVEQPSQFHDWMPTFADVADAVPPARTDGVSLLPMLTGHGVQRPPLTYIEYESGTSTPGYTEFDPSHRGRRRNEMQVIFEDGYKGVRYNIQGHGDDFEIYDLDSDPQEVSNLAASMPALQQQMKDRVLQVRRPNGSATRPYDNAFIPSVGAGGSNGVNYASYEGSWPWVPQFAVLTHTATGRISTVDLAVRTRDENIGVEFSGYVDAPVSGDYTFFMTSDSGGMLWVHDACLIDDDYQHDGTEQSGTIRLARGLHPFRIAYVHTNGTRTLDVQYAGPGIAKQSLPAAALYVNATGTVFVTSTYTWGGAGSLASPADWDSTNSADPAYWDNVSAPDLSQHAVTIPAGGCAKTDGLVISSTGSVTMTGGYLYTDSSGIEVDGSAGQLVLDGGHADAQWVSPKASGVMEIRSGFMTLRGGDQPIAASATGFIDFTGLSGGLSLPNKDSSYLANKMAAGLIRIDGQIPFGVGSAHAVNGRYFDNDVGTAYQLVAAGSYRELVMAGANPRTYLLLDEASGADHALDASGRANHGTPAVGVTFGGEGVVGRGATFNGTGYIIVDPALNPNGAGFSVEALVCHTTGGTTKIIVSQQDGTGMGRSLLLINADDELASFYGGVTTRSLVTLRAGRWCHVAVTVEENGSADEITFYVNGEPTPGGGTVAGEDADGAWVIGSHKGLSDNRHYGAIDEIAVYDRVLTAEAIAAHARRSGVARAGTCMALR